MSHFVLLYTDSSIKFHISYYYILIPVSNSTIHSHTTDFSIKFHFSYSYLLIPDKVKTKEKKKKKKKKKGFEEEEEEGEKIKFSDEVESYDKTLGFNDMNLSRPLLKVLCYLRSLRFR